MKRWFGIAMLLGLLSAAQGFASSDEVHGVAGGEHDKKAETTHFILHHVSDDESFELEIPFPPYHLPAIPIASWFGGLKFESEPGACEKPIADAWMPAPSLGQFLNGCYDLRPTKAILMMWIATAVLFVLLALGRKRDQNGVPQGLLSHLVEVLFLFVRD